MASHNGMSVEVRDVSKLYSGRGNLTGTTLVLDRLSLEIAGGDVVTIVGPSGCGKTTLLMCIAGLEPFDGTIALDGHLVDGPMEGVAVVFQARCSGARSLAALLVDRRGQPEPGQLTVGGDHRRENLVASGELGSDVAASAELLAVGLAISIVVGTVLGVAIGWSRILTAICEPFVVMIYAGRY